MNTPRRYLPLIVLIFLTSTLRAQVGPALLQMTWEKDQYFDTVDSGLFEAAAHTDGPGDPDVRISSYHFLGGYRLEPGNVGSTRIGFDVQDYDIVGHNPELPRNLLDSQIGFIQPILNINKWFVVVGGSLGFDGNKPFTGSNSVYATGDVIAGRQFNKDQWLFVGIDYNGNRTFLPDCPIPGFAYANRLNDYCTYVLGLPYSQVTFYPIEGFQFEAGFQLVETFDANLGYQFNKHVAVFGQYTDKYNPFHVQDTSPDSRLFFESHQLEVGLRFNGPRSIRLSVSGGWAFGQEFSTGFDSRNNTPLVHVADAPFAKVKLEIAF